MNIFSWGKFFFIMMMISPGCYVFSESLSSSDNWNKIDLEKEDSIVPNLQPENKWINQEQTQMRSYEEENRQMIENDRHIMERGYDPNETTEGFLKSDLNSKSPQQKSILEGDVPYKSNGK